MRLSPLVRLGMVVGLVIASLSPQPANASVVRQGHLELGDAIFFYDGSLYDDYAIQGELGQTIAIELRSRQFDPFLAIVGPKGEWLAQNNDVSSNDTRSFLSFTFPTTDTYYIFVNTYNPRGQGQYTLTLAPDPSASAVANEIVLVQGLSTMPAPVLISPPPVLTDGTSPLMPSSL